MMAVALTSSLLALVLSSVLALGPVASAATPPEPTSSPVVVVLRGDPAWITGLIALFAAGIGGLGSYFASVAVQNQARRARAAIRRKAKLYTPLRTKLLSVRESMGDPQRLHPIYAEAGHYQDSPWSFSLWLDMELDGRSLSVSPAIRHKMRAVMEAIERFNEEHAWASDRLNAVGPEVASRAGVAQWHPRAFMGNILAGTPLPGTVVPPEHEPDDQKRQEIVDRLNQEVMVHPEIEEVRGRLLRGAAALTAAIDDALAALEGAMVRIAERYEQETVED